MKKLVESNLPDSFPDLRGKYPIALSAENTLKRFNITRNELPDEITVQKPVSLDEYPKSLERQIYVSAKKGKDANSGAKDSPVKTLNEAVKRIKSGGGVVWVEGGLYEIAETVAFGKEQSGCDDAPLFIKGYGDEKAVFTTNKKIDTSGFKPVDTKNDERAARLKREVWDKVLCLNLYEQGWDEDDIADMAKTGPARLFIDGEELTLARFPNAFHADGSKTTEKELLYFKHVYERGSMTLEFGPLYQEWVARVKADPNLTLDSVIGWEVRVVDERDENVDAGDNYMGEEITSWKNDGNIWAYGSFHSGYERGYYNMAPDCVHGDGLLGLPKDDGFYSLKSIHPNARGAFVSKNSPAGRNTFYMLNAIEALDAPGEWYIDKKTGNLYLYPNVEDVKKVTMTYSGTIEEDLFRVSDASYIVFDNIHFDGANGSGVIFENDSNIVFQFCCVKNTKKGGVLLNNVTDSAVINSDFSQLYGPMVWITNTESMKTLTTSNLFIQNNFFHSPKYAQDLGCSYTGCRVVFSHNYYLNTILHGMGMECIIEYNHFDGGKKEVTDGGMVYMGSLKNRGNHIRYNLFHRFCASHNAVYLDGKASGSYAYCNIISALGAKTNFVKPWYSSAGQNNVFFANIAILRNSEQLKKTLYGDSEDEATGSVTTKDMINESCLFYYTGPNNPKTGDSEQGYAWTRAKSGWIRAALALYFEQFDAEAYKKRFPEFMEWCVAAKALVAAYDTTPNYAITYGPSVLYYRTFTYPAKDGETIWIPPYKYVDDNDTVQIMPERTAVAENGEGITLTYSELSAVDRVSRQPAFNCIKNNIVLGGSEDPEKRITNNAEKFLGVLRLTDKTDNFMNYDYNEILEDADNFDYTVKDSAWERMEKEMGKDFVEEMKKFDYSKVGPTK